MICSAYFVIFQPQKRESQPMSKPLVFISHITEEKQIAIAFKELIEISFLNMLEVFVSSDEDSIHMGQKWLDRISNSLKTCNVEIVLCSPKAIKRPWINFEAGAGWVRDIPVIPLCHSGIEPSQLPMPLNLLQAAKANEISSLKLIFPVLAQAIGAKTPAVDFSDFVNKVLDFEQRYTFWDACNEAFQIIHACDASIITRLTAGESISVRLTEPEISSLFAATEFLSNNEILSFTKSRGVVIDAHGTTLSRTFAPLPKFSTVVANPLFKL